VADEAEQASALQERGRAKTREVDAGEPGVEEGDGGSGS
jgi:hypothetical protein